MKKIELCSSEKLDIVKTFECGQCFRWNQQDDGSYQGVAFGYPAQVWEENGSVFLNSDAPDELWENYFDLNLDYQKISEPFLNVEYLDECTRAGMGIRILNQEPWEALCSFIISQCNNIKRIKSIVERLCLEFGEAVEFDGVTYYKFPSYENIALLDVEDLACLRAGYRAEYIIDAARALDSKTLDLECLKCAQYIEAKKELLKMNGIGEKVANCVILFGLHHMEAFPIDVWIRRALNEHFPKNFNPAGLGAYAGLAQQYIFYYMRLG